MTNHMVTGAVIALVIKQPALALPLSVLSHFVQDLLPHFGDNDIAKEGYFSRLKRTVVIIDAILATTFMIWLITHHNMLAVLCAIAAASPDFVWIYREIILKIRGSVKPRNALSKLHERLQWGERRWGWLIEIIYLAIMLRVLGNILS